MQKNNIIDILKNNSYPGRGIIIGNVENISVVYYFIMGRSANSRNRLFIATDDGIKTEAYDPSKVVDPSLIIYHPIRIYNNSLIVSNGDQTDTIYKYLKNKRDFVSALKEREFEPDRPNFTSRISGLLNEDGSYSLSILKAIDAEGKYCLREYFDYPKINGTGHFISTYEKDGDPLPCFKSEPLAIEIPANIEKFSQAIWSALNCHNKISLCCYMHINNIYKSQIFNKYER